MDYDNDDTYTIEDDDDDTTVMDVLFSQRLNFDYAGLIPRTLTFTVLA